MTTRNGDRVALHVTVEGIVQGVGFRPFIHRLALSTGVAGYVRNAGGSEVEVYLEGSVGSVSRFLKGLIEERPPPAIIESIEITPVKPRGLRGFRILRSGDAVIKRSMMPPDLAICPHCLAEVLDPNNRRFRYAFNSCAWCGPRFSMMYKAPYDRENTSMRDFPLCSECLREYRDVSNVRRYHAQGISCPKCGPRLWLEDRNGQLISADDPISEAAKLIDEGNIVAIKGLGGYHIAALASDDDVVLELRRRKKRPTKPFAIMGLNLSVLSKLVKLREEAEALLTSPQSPILLLPKAEGTPVSKYVSPGLDVEGVFLPYTALHYLLLQETRDKFLIMTSGNPHGKPMCTDEECARKVLSGFVDYFLHHDRVIVNRVDDSVLRFTDGAPVMLRRSRGYAPTWVKLGARLPKDVVAFGADLQGAGAVGFEDKVVLTQYVGDLEDLDTAQDLVKFLNYLIRNYRIEPKDAVVAVDKHPSYTSRSLGLTLAKEWGTQHVIEVQHHYAHALATMADHGLLGKGVVAVIADGVGFGDDGAVWGGEVFIIHEDLSYERVAHLEYIPLVGGNATVKYPARYLFTALAYRYGEDEALKVLRNSGALRGLRLGEVEARMLASAIESGNLVWSSSTGRFLDAASALLGVCLRRTYEGEPAIRLESFTRGAVSDPRILNSFTVEGSGTKKVINVADALMRTYELVYVGKEVKPRDAARSIQEGLGMALGRVAAEILKERGLDTIVLGGGVMVNDFIVRGLRKAVRSVAPTAKALLPTKVPAGDGGIALGQAVAVARFLK